MAKEESNIYAVAADAVDLALDTALTFGSMVGGIANTVGLGSSDKEKSEEQERREIDDAAERVKASVDQAAEAVKPRARKAHGAHASKTRATKSVKKAAKKPATRKAAR